MDQPQAGALSVRSPPTHPKMMKAPLPPLLAALVLALPATAQPERPRGGTDHWAFQPVKSDQPGKTLDDFLPPPAGPAGEALDATAWLRRVTLDLTGLPPTPAEVASFLADTGTDARARVVDRLLASPRHGERWAQHWLDVVRYADTHGFEVNTERPHAWPYRDWVIHALNADMPYDRFVRAQIAGDLTGDDAATGFLVTASVLLPGQIGQDDASKRLARQDSLDEMVVNIGQTFLGLTVGCARCHDHMTDPVSQRDYYAMQAFVAGVEYEDREMATPQALALKKKATEARAEAAAVERELAARLPATDAGSPGAVAMAKGVRAEFPPCDARFVRLTIHSANQHPTLGVIEPCLDEVEIFSAGPGPENVAAASNGARVTASGSRTSDIHRLEHVNDKLYGNSHSWMSDTPGRGELTFEFPGTVRIDRVVFSRDREGKFSDRLPLAWTLDVATAPGEWRTVAHRDEVAPTTPEEPDANATIDALRRRKGALEAEANAAEENTLVFAGRFRAPDAIHLLSRGDPEQPRELVGPAVPRVLGDLALDPAAPEAERRRALAEWIASPSNPLTARVMANRVWQGHFGLGLVETASDFGVAGARPTNAALLDWLAAELVRSGWSLRHLHRLIVLSRAYARTGEPPLARRRLDAEALRDSMLAVAGRLDLRMGGRGFDLFDQRGGLTGFTPVESLNAGNQRRLIYAHKVRREREAVFGAFDCPDAGQSTARRRESTTPIQALNLFNSRFTLETASAFADRLRREAGDSAPAQVDLAWQFALARPPSEAERTDALGLVAAHGLPALARALFNSNEFVFSP